MNWDLGIGLLEPWAMLGVIPLGYVLWRRLRSRPPSLLFPSRPAGVPETGASRPTALALRAAALVLGLVALARPATREVVEDSSRGIEIALVMDMSSSMQATDLDPKRSRLEVAKSSALEFIRARQQDRIALVTFARHADLACPSTRDHGALSAMVEDLGSVRPDTEEDATGVGNAVAYAADVLRGRSGTSRVMIVLTDGEENVAVTTAPAEIPPSQAAAACAAMGIRVHTIAVGAGTRLPDGSLRPLDTTALRQIADATGGAFFEARDADRLATVYRQLDSLESSEAGVPRVVVHDSWHLFALLAMLLWLSGLIFELMPTGGAP